MKGLPYSCFETSEFLKGHKFDAFRESINVIFDVKGPVAEGEKFFGKIKTYLIDEMLLVNVKATGQEFLRPNSMIAKDSVDHFLVQIFHKGGTNPLDFSHDNPCESGKILVLDASRPWRAFNPNFENLTLVFPRRLLKGKLLNEWEQHGRVIDTNLNPFAEILYKYMVSLEESAEKIQACDASSLVAPSVDLVAAALNFNVKAKSAERESVRVHYETGQKFRIKEFLDKNISTHHLSGENVQREFKMSRSHLYRLFSEYGGAMNYLRQRRMESAYKLLLSSQNLSIAQVAYSCGFLNESSFSRAFKKRFGLSPREARQEGLQARNESRNFSDLPGRVWEEWFNKL